MSRTETWIEVEAYSNSTRLFLEDERGTDPKVPVGAQSRTVRLVEGRWLVRWWRRVR